LATTSRAWLYTGDNPELVVPGPDGHCPELGDSFGGSFAGLEMTVVSYGGRRGNAAYCNVPAVELYGDTGPLESRVVEVHDASARITASFEPPSMLESRSAVPHASSDGHVRVAWSHAADLVGIVPEVLWQSGGEGPPSWSVTGAVEGDEIVYDIPASAAHAPGITHISTQSVRGTAASCTGATACTYELDHDAAF
jgi:hypothetical protein